MVFFKKLESGRVDEFVLKLILGAVVAKRWVKPENLVVLVTLSATEVFPSKSVVVVTLVVDVLKRV